MIFFLPLVSPRLKGWLGVGVKNQSIFEPKSSKRYKLACVPIKDSMCRIAKGPTFLQVEN